MANDFQARACAFIVAALRVIVLVICILAIFGIISTFWALIAAERYLDYYTSSHLYTSIMYFYYTDIACLFIVSSIGAHAAYNKNSKYLKMFAVLLLIQAILANSIMTVFYLTTDWNHQKTQLSELLQDYARDYQFRLTPFEEPNYATKAWDRLQNVFMCCGFDSKYDWLNTTSNEFTLNIRMPSSCCDDISSRYETCRLLNSNVHETGCWEAIEKLLPTSFALICIDFISFCCVAAIALFLAHKYNRANVVEAQSKPQTLIAMV